MARIIVPAPLAPEPELDLRERVEAAMTIRALKDILLEMLGAPPVETVSQIPTGMSREQFDNVIAPNRGL